MILINHHCSEWSLPSWHRKAPYATESPDTVKGALANRRRTYHEHFESNLGTNGVCECWPQNHGIVWVHLISFHLFGPCESHVTIQKQSLKKALQTTLKQKSLQFTWAMTCYDYTRTMFKFLLRGTEADHLSILNIFFMMTEPSIELENRRFPLGSRVSFQSSYFATNPFGPGSRQAVHSATVPMTGSFGCQLDGIWLCRLVPTVPAIHWGVHKMWQPKSRWEEIVVKQTRISNRQSSVVFRPGFWGAKNSRLRKLGFFSHTSANGSDLRDRWGGAMGRCESKLCFFWTKYSEFNSDSTCQWIRMEWNQTSGIIGPGINVRNLSWWHPRTSQNQYESI